MRKAGILTSIIVAIALTGWIYCLRTLPHATVEENVTEKVGLLALGLLFSTTVGLIVHYAKRKNYPPALLASVFMLFFGLILWAGIVLHIYLCATIK